MIAAHERRLLASPTGLIETHPNEAYPTDVAAAAIARTLLVLVLRSTSVFVVPAVVLVRGIALVSAGPFGALEPRTVL